MKVVSALWFISSFSNQISDTHACNIIHPHFQADHHVSRKQVNSLRSGATLKKYQGDQILEILCVQG